MYESIEIIKGMTMTAVRQVENDQIIFETIEGQTARLYHPQDCCESVYIEDVVGDLDDLIGSPILMAEQVTSDTNPEDIEKTCWILLRGLFTSWLQSRDSSPFAGTESRTAITPSQSTLFVIDPSTPRLTDKARRYERRNRDSTSRGWTKINLS